MGRSLVCGPSWEHKLSRDHQGGQVRHMPWLLKLDLAAHVTAFASCAAGGIVLESVALMGTASHHVASIAVRLLSNDRHADRGRSNARETSLIVVLLLLCTTCLLLALYVTALGAHGMFHVETLDTRAIAVFLVPGVVAALTTAALALWSDRNPRNSVRADALLSAAPTALVLFIAFSAFGPYAGRLDALGGLVIVLMLCLRLLVQLGRAFD
jgi:uncharacterized BrkB/YihY/UPF0761 family membrane protein